MRFTLNDIRFYIGLKYTPSQTDEAKDYRIITFMTSKDIKSINFLGLVITWADIDKLEANENIEQGAK